MFLAEWLKACKRSDPKLNDCLKDGLQTMFPALSKGKYFPLLTFLPFSKSRFFFFRYFFIVSHSSFQNSGIPEIEVQRFEPLFLKEIGVSKGHGAVSLTGAMHDLLVYGPSNATTTYVSYALYLINLFKL